MSTKTRPELSEKNKYWIERHRFYELKHFCMQYPIWKKAYAALDGLSKRPDDLQAIQQHTGEGDPTAKCAISKLYYLKRMELIDQAALGADPMLAEYLITGVTEGISYDILKARLDIPCSKDTYYDRYRRFFWLLNKARN
jgi:hypothetical protein